jgi:hypothetical protein
MYTIVCIPTCEGLQKITNTDLWQSALRLYFAVLAVVRIMTDAWLQAACYIDLLSAQLALHSITLVNGTVYSCTFAYAVGLLEHSGNPPIQGNGRIV